MIRKVLMGFIMLCSMAYSNDFLMSFYNAGGHKTTKLEKLLKKDLYYKNVEKALTQKEEREFKYKDVETKNEKTFTTKVINWKYVLEQSIKSVDSYNNSVSAFIGLHVLKTFYPLNNKNDENSKRFLQFSKMLYENEKEMCQSYLDYADVYMKGLASAIDYNRAYSIYKEGQQYCKKGWHKNIVESKLWYLKRKLNNGKK